jgi:hypothetical protein
MDWLVQRQPNTNANTHADAAPAPPGSAWWLSPAFASRLHALCGHSADAAVYFMRAVAGRRAQDCESSGGGGGGGPGESDGDGGDGGKVGYGSVEDLYQAVWQATQDEHTVSTAYPHTFV